MTHLELQHVILTQGGNVKARSAVGRTQQGSLSVDLEFDADFGPDRRTHIRVRIFREDFPTLLELMGRVGGGSALMLAEASAQQARRLDEETSRAVARLRELAPGDLTRGATEDIADEVESILQDLEALVGDPSEPSEGAA